MPVFAYQDMLPLGEDATPYRLLTRDYVRALDVGGRPFVEVDREGLALLAREAMRDIAHLLRPGGHPSPARAMKTAAQAWGLRVAGVSEVDQGRWCGTGLHPVPQTLTPRRCSAPARRLARPT